MFLLLMEYEKALWNVLVKAYDFVSYQVGKHLHKLTFTMLGWRATGRICRGTVDPVGPYT
jgi:hypothetical protein